MIKQLQKVGNSNAQGEYYLPDVLPLLKLAGAKVGVEICETFSDEYSAKDFTN